MSDQSAPTAAAAPSSETPPAAGPHGPALWRLVRAVLARYLHFTGRHRFLGCLGLLFLMLFLCGGSSLLLARLAPATRDFAPIDVVPVNQTGTVINDGEAPVDAYLDGMRNFDAQRMWTAYTDRTRSDLTARGRSPQDLQRGLDQAKAGGARVNGVVHLGSYPLRDGRRYLFYIVSRSGFPPDGADEELYFIFTVDPDGYILNVT